MTSGPHLGALEEPIAIAICVALALNRAAGVPEVDPGRTCLGKDLVRLLLRTAELAVIRIVERPVRLRLS